MNNPVPSIIILSYVLKLSLPLSFTSISPCHCFFFSCYVVCMESSLVNCQHDPSPPHPSRLYCVSCRRSPLTPLPGIEPYWEGQERSSYRPPPSSPLWVPAPCSAVCTALCRMRPMCAAGHGCFGRLWTHALYTQETQNLRLCRLLASCRLTNLHLGPWN